jgi:uncharacterized protein (TIGR03437 family)
VIFVSETQDHFIDESPSSGDPGIGLFSNLWAADLNTGRFWQLTDIPIKKTLTDGIVAMATVNPNISPEGTQLVWTERYANAGNFNWGRWRLKTSPLTITENSVSLAGERVLYAPNVGNYVTSMGFFDLTQMVVAGNLAGQHEFGMDLYRLSTLTGETRQLLNTADTWEEGACISPNGRYIVYMTNATSRYRLNFNDADWASQPLEREYFLMDANGGSVERLTYFNDASAREYLGRRVITAACSFSPDGRYLTGTLGVDYGTEQRAALELKVARIEFASPQLFADALPAVTEGSVVNGASLVAGIAPNSWVTLFGTNLAPQTRLWTGADFNGRRLPTALDGVSVRMNGQPAYVYYISPTQINVLAPETIGDGTVTIEVTTAAGTSRSVQAQSQRLAPAFFPFGQGRRYVAAVHLDGTYVGPPNLIPGAQTRPAKPGDIVQLYATGFGPTTPAVTAAEIPGVAPTVSTVRAQIGGVEAQVQFAGIVGPGLYQINVVIPDVSNGDQPLVAEIEGRRTQDRIDIAIMR